MSVVRSYASIVCAVHVVVPLRQGDVIMSTQTRFKQAADLVDRMASQQALDLETLVLRGQLSMDAIGEAVVRCAGCTDPEGCDAWLGLQTVPVARGPEMCRNQPLFDLLKDGKSA